MKFVKVERIPGHTKVKQKPVKGVLEDFLSSDVKCARVDLEDGEYSRPSTAYSTLYEACYRYKLPLAVTFRGGDIYIFRTDM